VRQRHAKRHAALTTANGNGNAVPPTTPQNQKHPHTTPQASTKETKATLNGCGFRRLRLRLRLPTSPATTKRHIFNPFGHNDDNKTTQKRQKNGETAKGKRDDYKVAPEAPVGG